MRTLKPLHNLCALLALMLISGGVAAQNVPTKSQLIKIFKSSISQRDKKSISVGSGAWYACNGDSAFFKSDTVKLYNNINYFYQIDRCCSFVNWTFYKKDGFLQSTSQICNEPATASAKTVNCTIKYYSEKGRIKLIIGGSRKYPDVYEVKNVRQINLANNQKVTEITLVAILLLNSTKPITGPTH